MRTVADLFAAWPSAAPGLRPRSAGTVEHTIGMAGSFERRFGARLLVNLEPVDCARWAAKHPAHVRYARTILADAVLMGVLEVSPLAGVRVSARQVRGEYVPDDDEVLLLAEEGARYGLREFVLVAAGSGARLSALAGLQAADVAIGPVPGTMTLQMARKGREGRYPALLLRPGCDELMQVAPAVGLVFRRPRGGMWDRRTVSKRWVLMREALGLPEACTFHSLRKHYATRLLDMGVSDIDAAFALDHVDARGRPNPELVRKIYGRPDRGEALGRIARAA